MNCLILHIYLFKSSEMKTKRFLWASLLAVLLLSSCASRKSFVYLNDMDMGVEYQFDVKKEAVVHRDDRLSITVSCKNPELAIPFNMQGGNFHIGADGNVVSSDISSGVREKGYRVDVDGNIDFPILGTLHVEGLKVSELTDLVKRRIIEGNYIKDPLVSVEFLNFKYTVLGAVGNNGTFSVNGDRVTLIEAIARAGDLTSKARVDRVAVIRETERGREMYMHDLRSKDVFDSPCYFLQQNDIVYVEPKYKKRDAEDRGWQIATTTLSLASVICSLIWALR